MKDEVREKDNAALFFNLRTNELHIIIGNETLIIDKFQKDVRGNFIRQLGACDQIKIVKKFVANIGI